MPLSKESILNATNQGLRVFQHFLGHRLGRVGRSFKNPFYDDRKASCYVYLDKRSGVYKFKDFGDMRYSGDCFSFVGMMFRLNCQDKPDFIRIMEIINHELLLRLEDHNPTVDRLLRIYQGKVIRASELPASREEIDIATPQLPLVFKPFTVNEYHWWGQFGITPDVLEQFHVRSVQSFSGKGRNGNSYVLESTPEQPMFGYEGLRHTKLYRPFSTPRFLFTGEKADNYIFGFEQLPIRGYILFITGGEKDVLSLVANGFSAITMNSETALIPKNLLRGLTYRFKHIVLLYDADETGLNSMHKLCADNKEYNLKYLVLPLAGTKEEKDISDFFRLGHTEADLKMLFLELLDKLYEDTNSIMRTCEINFDFPPAVPRPLITINDVTVGTPGNLMCVAGAEGSGKTNYLGGILSGAIRPVGTTIDTLGTSVRENSEGGAVLLYDTEQSESQLYKNMTYIVQRSAQSRPPVWFRAFCLVGISRNERMKLILESMDKFFYEYGSIHLVVIDGIADLLGGVNDEESSVALIEELFRLAAIYNTVIICVLHLAPSGMKLRGHLGSEVQRKAAGILLVEKDDDNNCSVVKALKVRDGSPLDVPMVQFGWSKEEGRHIFMGEKSKDDSHQRKLEELSDIAASLFHGRGYIAVNELTQLLMDALSIKDRMARNHIKFMRENAIIEVNGQFPGSFGLVGSKMQRMES